MPQHDQVTIVKDFSYRGNVEEWSNSYMLTGTTPTTDAAWKTLFDAIIASEKNCYNSATRVVRAMGYKATENFVTYSYDYKGAAQTVAGATNAGPNGQLWAGDQAAWLRMRVGSTATGKPKYIRKYFHGGASPLVTPDLLNPTLATAYVAHGALMVGGTLPGQMKWCGPGQVIGTAPAASPFVTTRTLKRRGKRPTPPQP